MGPTDLTEPERLLWQAFARGAWVDLRSGDPAGDDPAGASRWGPERVIRAEVIRALLLGAAESEPGHVPAVRLRGALITGRLDLMGATVAYPLVCEYCRFDEEVRLVESALRTVRIVDSRLPSLNGTRMRLSGILNLWGSQIAGMIRLDQARVDGQFCLSRAVIGAGAGTVAVAADGLAVDGGFEGVALRTVGSVAMENATVTGAVDLSEAHITGSGQRALTISRAVLGRLDGRGMTVEGETRMHNTRIGSSMVLAGATLDNPGEVALSAGGLSVAGGVFLTDITAVGEVRLYGASLDANLTIAGSTLRNPGGTALSLDRATLGVFHGEGVTVAGRISLIGAQVGTGLSLRGSLLTGDAGHQGLTANGASVGGDLNLDGLVVDGEVRLRTVRVGQRILLSDAVLKNPGGTALRLTRAQVAADVFCDGMTSAGRVKVAGAMIGGELDFRRARISNAGAVALDAVALDAGELSLRLAEPAEGLVDLRHARARIIRDDPATWPRLLSVDGLTYDALEPRLPAQRRLDWLARDPDGHQPRPYEQLAAHYTAIGQPDQARRVMYASERILRRTKTPLSQAWGLLQDITIGYGYRPWRALAWLALLLAAGSVTFAVSPPPPLQPSQAPHFNPVIYTLDLLLPVVDLGQKHAFNPGGAEQWLSYVLIAAGWLLVTTVAAGAARVLSRR